MPHHAMPHNVSDQPSLVPLLAADATSGIMARYASEAFISIPDLKIHLIWDIFDTFGLAEYDTDDDQ